MTSENPKETHVEVAVVTTSGRYPATGNERVPLHQPVRDILRKAVKELRIVDTTNWIARVDGREIDPALNYEQNQLSGTITIDYGPREGGGGA